jgi:hypothetical protein
MGWRIDEIFKEIKTLKLQIRADCSKEKKEEMMESIDKLYDELEKLRDNFNSDSNSRLDPNKVNKKRVKDIDETIEIMRPLYAQIFNSKELEAINNIKSKGGSVFLNRSYLQNKLIVKAAFFYENPEKYAAIELGYSNKDSIPWGFEEVFQYTIDENGQINKYDADTSNLIFIHLNKFF